MSTYQSADVSSYFGIHKVPFMFIIFDVIQGFITRSMNVKGAKIQRRMINFGNNWPNFWTIRSGKQQIKSLENHRNITNPKD